MTKYGIKITMDKGSVYYGTLRVNIASGYIASS